MNHKDFWISIIEKLFDKIDRAQIITWFRNTAILSLKDGVLNIGLPSPFFLNWHITNFSRKTLEAAKEINPEIVKVTYDVDSSLNPSDPRVVDLLKHFPEKTARKLPRKNEQKTKDGLISKMLNPDYKLDNFITSPENRLAHAACQNVAKYPGRNYNPLFIYGGVGLGKTHLLQAAGNEIIRNNPGCLVLYVTTETFVNEVVDCIQKRNMAYLRNKYRRVDVLIVDDIQFIINKDRTQEEFFHTFNALYESGKQVIISSDRPPSELKPLNERLVSRFESGMTVDVKMPDYETRLAILQHKCQEAQVFINHEILEFIAMNVSHSVRALEGVLTRIIADYELSHIAPTMKAVKKIIDMNNGNKEMKMIGFEPEDAAPKKAVTIDNLIESVSDYYTIPKNDVLGNSRTRECIVPRQVIMYLAKNKLRMSLVKIGQVIGNRNHTTVMNAISKVGRQLKNDRQLLRDMNAIVREVGIH